MAIEDAHPKTGPILNCIVGDLISSNISNLVSSEVNQGKVFQAVVVRNRNSFRRNSYDCLKAPSRQKSWSKWV
jgi:ribosomal protein L14